VTSGQGRELPAGPFAGDDGAADPTLARALDRLGADARAEVEVVAALAQARLFVAIVARSGDGAELDLLTVTAADGRRALPVFSSVATLARWRPEARPVPVPGRRAALSAVADGCDLVDLDPAGPVRYLVRRPAVWALGRGRDWVPSYADADLAREVAAHCAQEGLLSHCEPGTTAELRVVLGAPEGRTGPQVHEAMERLSRRLAESERFTDAVDSLELTVAPTRPRPPPA
jgi:hypothetical protein